MNSHDTVRANLLLTNIGRMAVSFAVGFGFVAGLSGTMIALAVALMNREIDLYAVGTAGLVAGACGAIFGLTVWAFIWRKWMHELLGMGNWYGHFGYSELRFRENNGHTLRSELYPVHVQYWKEMAIRAINGSKPTFRGWSDYFKSEFYFIQFTEEIMRRGYAIPEGEAWNSPIVWTEKGIEWWKRILAGEIKALPHPAPGGVK